MNTTRRMELMFSLSLLQNSLGSGIYCREELLSLGNPWLARCRSLSRALFCRSILPPSHARLRILQKAPLLAFIPLLAASAQAQVTVEGQVAAVDGAPLKADLTLIRSGSTVEFHHYHTDDQGAFSIETDQTVGQLLVAKADGHTSSEVVLKAESNTKISVPFTLWPSGTVTGRVVDEEGNGVGGAILHVHYANERRRHFLHHEMGDIHADDFGYFTLPVMARGRDFVVEAASEGHLPGSTDTLRLEDEKLDVQVTTGKLRYVVRGTVTASAANPHKGVGVRMRLFPGMRLLSPPSFRGFTGVC